MQTILNNKLEVKQVNCIIINLKSENEILNEYKASLILAVVCPVENDKKPIAFTLKKST